MEAARVEAQLAPTVSPDSSCSVYWLVPEHLGELDAAISSATSSTGTEPWGFLGWWENSKDLKPYAADISQADRLAGYYRIGDVGMKASVLALAALRDEWFWQLFAGGIHPHQICGALMPPDVKVPAGWSYAGLQLVLSQAARQVRPGRATHQYSIEALAQAFLAEVVLAGGIAVTRLQAELLPPGLALTASREVIDEVEAEFQSYSPASPIKVQRSIALGGNWLSVEEFTDLHVRSPASERAES